MVSPRLHALSLRAYKRAGNFCVKSEQLITAFVKGWYILTQASGGLVTFIFHLPSSMLALLTPLYIFAVGYAFQLSMTDPNARPPKEQVKLVDFTSRIQVLTRLYKFAYKLHIIVETTLTATTVLANTYSGSNSLHQMTRILENAFLVGSTHKRSLVTVPPIRVFSGFLILLSTAIRLRCFCELGKQFTFFVSLQDDHKLITSGPYSVVRHPAYAAVLLTYGGSVLWCVTPGAWLRESEIYRMPVAWLVLGPLIFLPCFAFRMVLNRVRQEDKLMKTTFGDKWAEWSKAVPYRLIPGLY